MEHNPKYTNLAFEGGGVNGIAYCGALQEMTAQYDPRFVDHTVNYAGSSVGSIVSSALAAGASLEYLEKKMRGINFEEFCDDSWGVVADAWRVATEFGFYKGERLRDFIGETMHELTGNRDITLAQLYSRGRNLVVTGTEVTKGGAETRYFSRLTKPDAMVKDVVRISSSFPLFFKAVNWDKKLWVDGGLLYNYPVGVFDTKRYCHGGFNHETLGFKIVSHTDAEEYEDAKFEDDDSDDAGSKPSNLKDFCVSMGEAVYDQCQRVYISPRDWERTVKINVGNSSSMNFNLTTAEKDALIEAGKKGAREFLAAKK